MNMKQIFTLSIVCVSLFSCGGSGTGSKPDTSFDVSVQEPQLAIAKPKILFDEAHNNTHHLDNTYKPFAQLLKNDGCDISACDESITAQLLSQVDIYITGCAHGEVDPGDACPFTSEEINALADWVSNGGSLLIITEHYPFGIAMAPLLSKFKITVHNGYTEDSLLTNPSEPGALVFEKVKGNLNANHPILDNVERVNTFTGTSVKGDSSYIPLLILSDSAINYDVMIKTEKKGDDLLTSVVYGIPHSAAGYVQAICKEYGQGKIVVLTDAAMVTAQIDRAGGKFGMNIPHTDNKQFVLNMIRWLATK